MQIIVEIVAITFRILGGLVLFMFSISMLSDILKRVAGIKLKSILERTTSNPFSGMATGAAVTFIVQSSSVTVLLLLGLVNAGAMTLNQAIFVILGSEIGTTITAQIVAFKVTVFFFPMIIGGWVLHTFFPSHEKIKNSGKVLFSLGLVFLAMNIMSDGARPLRDFPQIIDLIAQFGNYPLYGIFIGTILTAITSSSSATTSMVIAMSMEGAIDLTSGIALIIGANLGTCLLELIAVAGTSISAKRTGLAQFLINLIGALLIYPVIDQFAALIAHTASDIPRQIANAHTLFNISVSFTLLPFSGILIYVLRKLLPGKDRKLPSLSAGLDKRFLKVPALALSKASEEVHAMLKITEEMLNLAGMAFFTHNKDAGATVREYEKKIDLMNIHVTEYLGLISTILLSERDRLSKRALAHALTDIERIADLAENLVKYTEQKEIVFSDAARKDLENIFTNATSAYQTAVMAAGRKRKILHADITNMEEQFTLLRTELRNTYYLRQATMGDKTATDAFYPAVMRDLERISGHAFNIVEHFDNQ